jgi:hypothetical protein
MTSTIEDHRPSERVEPALSTAPRVIRDAPLSPTALARGRAAARTRDIAELLLRRPELVGVHAPADIAFEAVTWSA